MDDKEIIGKLQGIFCDILDNDEIVITSETNADDIEEWDSLTHVQIVHAIENEFKIKFTSYEISSWIDVEELVDCIVHKLKK